MGLNIEQNITLFQELIRCGSNLYLWCYDGDGTLLHSTCPEPDMLDSVFVMFGCKNEALQYGAANDRPLTVGASIGVRWGVDFVKKDGVLDKMYVIGPTFFYDFAIRDVENALRQDTSLNASLTWRHSLIDILPTITTVSNTMFLRYLLMLHYCVSQEVLDASLLNNQVLLDPHALPVAKHRDRHKVWMTEQALLQMVRTGDLNYHGALSNSMLISNGVPLKSPDLLRQSKNSIIVFTSMVCRAAVDGGLSPEQAYSLGDAYIQSIESAKSLSEVMNIPVSMYDDFIRRVHQCRTNPKLSPLIQKCLDYIETHLSEKLNAELLGEIVGYSEYYVTRKFKKETGYFINDYIKFAKIEHAKILLHTTQQTIQELSEAVGFSNRSYFSMIFKQVTGLSPTEFRGQSARP